MFKAVLMEAVVSTQPGNSVEQLHPNPDDFCRFWNFEDLVERRIVSTRTDLSNKQKHLGFPRPIKLTGAGQGNAASFSVALVKLWPIERSSGILRWSRGYVGLGQAAPQKVWVERSSACRAKL